MNTARDGNSATDAIRRDSANYAKDEHGTETSIGGQERARRSDAPPQHRRDERPQKRAFERFAGTACKRAHRAETNTADEEDDERQARLEDGEQQARPVASPQRATSDAGMRYEQCARLCEKAAVRE